MLFMGMPGFDWQVMQSDPHTGEWPGFCLSGRHSLTFDLAIFLTSVVGEMLTTTLTARQTRLTPEFSVCWSMQGCLSSSVTAEKGCTEFYLFFLHGFECWWDIHSSDAKETLQKCARNLVLFLFSFPSSVHTRPRPTLTTEQKLL